VYRDSRVQLKRVDLDLQFQTNYTHKTQANLANKNNKKNKKKTKKTLSQEPIREPFQIVPGRRDNLLDRLPVDEGEQWRPYVVQAGIDEIRA
jgi:hypothetical protein